jgi:hypothetical protein
LFIRGRLLMSTHILTNWSNWRSHIVWTGRLSKDSRRLSQFEQEFSPIVNQW